MNTSPYGESTFYVRVCLCLFNISFMTFYVFIYAWCSLPNAYEYRVFVVLVNKCSRFVAEACERDPKKCWPFSEKSLSLADQESFSLPLSAPKFRWWRCTSCVKDIDTDETKTSGKLKRISDVVLTYLYLARDLVCLNLCMCVVAFRLWTAFKHKNDWREKSRWKLFGYSK